LQKDPTDIPIIHFQKFNNFFLKVVQVYFRKRQFIMAVFFISAMTPNDRGYGHLAVCGSIRCRGTTK